MHSELKSKKSEILGGCYLPQRLMRLLCYFSIFSSLIKTYLSKNWIKTITKSLTENFPQVIIDIIFEQLWKVDQKTILMEIFFQDQNLKGLAENQVQKFLSCRGRHLSVSDWDVVWSKFWFRQYYICVNDQSQTVWWYYCICKYFVSLMSMYFWALWCSPKSTNQNVFEESGAFFNRIQFGCLQ